MSNLCLCAIGFKLKTCSCKRVQRFCSLNIKAENLLSFIVGTYCSFAKLLHIEAAYCHLLRCKLRNSSLPAWFCNQIIVFEYYCKCTIVGNRLNNTFFIPCKRFQQVILLCFFSAVNLYELTVLFS